MIKNNILQVFIFLCLAFSFQAQKIRTTVNAYGHFNLESNFLKDTSYANLKLGEQELFITTRFNDRFSFLGEITTNYLGHGNFRLNFERARLKYNYYKNHSFIIGKFHTPVNYWNDVYFHARLFFPTIDRPLMFSRWIPIHTFGVRMQGQNIGKNKFGYDVLIGNDMSNENLFSLGRDNSITAAVHWKPKDELRFGASYYHSYISDVSAMASHHHAHDDSNLYSGSLRFHMANSSFAYFSENWEVLNEFSYVNSTTDSLGMAHNFSNFLYVGKRIKQKNVPFIGLDYIYVDDDDLHSMQTDVLKFIGGYKYEYSENINIKIQGEYYTQTDSGLMHGTSDVFPKFEFKIQMSYGF